MEKMESDLDKSVRLLEEAIPKSKNKLIRLPHGSQTTQGNNTIINSPALDLSLTIDPLDVRLIMDHTGLANETEMSRLKLSMSNTSLAIPNNKINHLTEELYERFLEILQTHTSDSEIFETISDLTQLIIETIEDVRKVGKRETHQTDAEEWLLQEKNTWQLLYALYKDRLMVQNEEMDLDDALPLGNSEKLIIEHLYNKNPKLREYQLVVDWLEETALERSTHIGHFSDRTVGWENTLHQLQGAGLTIFSASKEIVKHLDPDAPFREKRPLHDLDQEDEQRITKQIFLELRRGHIEEAQSLCEHYGQPWRAAILEGWRLHHDPNYESVDSTGSKQPIEGNPQRDLWKRCAWQMADNIHVDDFSRAIAGLLCGHLDSLLNVAKNEWSDLLWAYLKVQIDIRVESEIRDGCVKSYLKMPDKYWNNKMSLEQIFDELKANKSHEIQSAAKRPVHIIQQYLILDDIPELMRNVELWISDKNISSQMLRFLAHIVLFMRQIGKTHQENISDTVIKAYVESLIKLGNAKLVAYYTAALPSELQLYLYSQFMETISNSDDRRVCFNEAISHGLDIHKITFYTVEKIRNYESETTNVVKLPEGQIPAMDSIKINSLEWLTFGSEQICDLLWQANALVRTFIAQNKIECVRKTFKVVPNDAIQHLIRFYGSKDNLPFREDCAIKEHFCHQTYLAAIDGYNYWSDYFYNQKPKALVQRATRPSGFTEKVALEHQEQTYRSDMEKWKQKVTEQTKHCRDLFYNILLFPDRGWLQEDPMPDDFTPTDPQAWHTRATQMENLRKIVIPDIILLLFRILTLSGQHQECMKLVDELANEERTLYKVYTKQRLSEFLMKIAETSLTLLNEKKDPWGFGGN